jgi:tripartite-type tricarboxylate transporter receptor subunit TctC
MRRILVPLILAVGLANGAHAQTYPSKPVRLIAGFPAGGGVDATARAYAQKLAEYWGQPVIVENRPGANGMVGAEAVARAASDGYTLFLSTPSEVALNPLLYARVPYDPLRDLAPISLVAVYPNVMVVNASVPARTVSEVVALAKKTPGGLHYGSSGTGSTQHLAGEWLQRYADFNWVHVPYKGAAPATTDIVGGQIPIAVLGLGAIMPHIKSGRLRAIAVVSRQRSVALPEVPTLHEAGIQFDATQWYGILTAGGTRQEIVSQINGALKRASVESAVADRLLALGGEPTSSTPEEYAALIRSETEKFRKVVRDANIKAD